MGILKAEQERGLVFVDHLLCEVKNWAFPATCFRLILSGLWQSSPCYSHLKDEAAEAWRHSFACQSQRASGRGRIRTRASRPRSLSSLHDTRLPSTCLSFSCASAAWAGSLLSPMVTAEACSAVLLLQPAIRGKRETLGRGGRAGLGTDCCLAFLQPPVLSAVRRQRCLCACDAAKRLT